MLNLYFISIEYFSNIVLIIPVLLQDDKGTKRPIEEENSDQQKKQKVFINISECH